MIDRIRELFINNEIEEIYTIGIVDSDTNIAEYIYDNRWIYFQVGEKFLKFESIENYWRLKVDIVDEIQINEAIFDDVLLAKSSIGNIILVGGTDSLGHNNVEEIYVYNIVENETIVCDAIEFCLDNGQCIFLDPRCLGIKIGNEIQKKMWFRNYGEDVRIKKITI